jgi:hypothetical protein
MTVPLQDRRWIQASINMGKIRKATPPQLVASPMARDRFVSKYSAMMERD